MNNRDVIFDLNRCANKDPSFCKECKHRNYGDSCCIQLMKDALDLINRQRAELKGLEKENHRFADIGKTYSEIKSEAIKEFAERLKEAPIKCTVPWLGVTTRGEFEEHFDGVTLQIRDAIDTLVKEMVGE